MTHCVLVVEGATWWPLFAGQEAVSSSAEPQLGPDDVDKLIARLQKKDTYHFFRDPVTNAVVGARFVFRSSVRTYAPLAPRLSPSA